MDKINDWFNVNEINLPDVRRSIQKNQSMTGRTAAIHWHLINQPCTPKCETVEPTGAP